MLAKHIPHRDCSFSLGGRCDMGVGVKGEPCGEVAKDAGRGLDVHAVLQGDGCEGVPLRYNNDKPEKPRISRVFGYLAGFFILFQTEKSSHEIVVIQEVFH